MKPTDKTSKSALLHATTEEMLTERFKNFVDNLRRTGHELVADDETAADLLQNMGLTVTPLGKFIDPFVKDGECMRPGFLNFTVIVLVDRGTTFNFATVSGGTSSVYPEDVLEDLYRSESSTAVITAPREYDWFEKKQANVHGVRKKDRAWLLLKAALAFKLGYDIVMDLVQKTRPRKPRLEAAFKKEEEPV